MSVPCADGVDRTYCSLDSAASTGALPAVVARVDEFLPVYSSVHRGAGYKSRRATEAYENARTAALAFAGKKPDRSHIAVICRNTTEAINHIAYRMRFDPDDVVLTTVVEHHANLLPWGRVARRRFVECGSDGTFDVADIVAGLEEEPRPRLLAVTAASNVSGWVPPMDDILDAAHQRRVPVLVDAAQLAPHRPIPEEADYVAWSGHKMYAPFGASAFVGPRETFADGDPFLEGGGAVELVDLDEVVWTDPPDREEAGSPNVVGAVALHAAIEEVQTIGWEAIMRHERALAEKMRTGLAAIEGVTILGPGVDADTLALASFVIEGVPHALVAARLSAEFAIGVRHGCFCAHPYLLRLLGMTPEQVAIYRAEVRAGDRRGLPGAVRASAAIDTTPADIDRLLDAVAVIASGEPPPMRYRQDETTGDFVPEDDFPGWSGHDRSLGASCARG